MSKRLIKHAEPDSSLAGFSTTERDLIAFGERRALERFAAKAAKYDVFNVQSINAYALLGRFAVYVELSDITPWKITKAALKEHAAALASVGVLMEDAARALKSADAIRSAREWKEIISAVVDCVHEIAPLETKDTAPLKWLMSKVSQNPQMTKLIREALGGREQDELVTRMAEYASQYRYGDRRQKTWADADAALLADLQARRADLDSIDRQILLELTEGPKNGKQLKDRYFAAQKRGETSYSTTPNA